MDMTIPQCRAARALIGWTAADLATRAQIGAATVRRFESGQTVQPEMVARMAAALVAAGLELYAGGAVFKTERKGARIPPKAAVGGETLSDRVGEQARAAMDGGIATLFEIQARAGKTGKLQLEDYRVHWAIHSTAKELEAALGAAREQTKQMDRPRLDDAIAVLQAARLAHV